MTTQTTRRALIGGAGLAGVALIAPALAIAAPPSINSAAAWDKAFAEHERTVALADLHEWEGPCCDVENAAWRTLMEVPAPHAKALHWKLNYLFGSDGSNGFCDSWANDVVQVVVKDALRLAGGAA